MPKENVSSLIYARVGLLGNPSDAFQGAAIAIAITNYWAVVEFEPSPNVEIVAHPKFDPSCFPSLFELSLHASKVGYYGGQRLLMVRC